MTVSILLLSYAFGYWLSFTMLRIEHESENQPYTFGARLMSVAISIGSLLSVFIILTITWIKKIGQTGYWARQIKPVKKEDAAK